MLAANDQAELHRARFLDHALIGEFALRLLVLVEREPHAAQDMRRLGELDVRVFDDFEPVAPWIEEVEERTLDHACAGRLGEFDDARTVIDDKADMAALDVLSCGPVHQRHVDELVAHVDEGVALALAAQGEIENPPIPVERLIDVADLDRDMIDADQPWFVAFAHVQPP